MDAPASSSLSIDSVFNVSGIVAIVTGGGTGIGSMIARTLASNGAKVYIVSRRVEVLEECVKAFEKDHFEGGKLVALPGDLSTKRGIEELKLKVEKLEPCLDLLVNNAAIIHRCPLSEPKTIDNIARSMWSVEEADAEAVYRTNLLGPYYASAAFLPLLGRSNSNPQIINISSVASFMRTGSQSGLMYPMSKAALNHLTKILATELRDTNVRCNAIAPGLFQTPMTQPIESQPTLRARLHRSIPAGRAGTEQEIGAAILFLASAHQSYVNGAIIPLDGGFLGVTPSTY